MDRDKIRCYQCKSFNDNTDGLGYCDFLRQLTKAVDTCQYRKEKQEYDTKTS